MLICGVLGKTFHLWFDYIINVQWIERIIFLVNMLKSNKGLLGEANNTICQQKCECCFEILMNISMLWSLTNLLYSYKTITKKI
jgi:hypothetical protein